MSDSVVAVQGERTSPPTFLYAEFEDGTVYALTDAQVRVEIKQDVQLPVGNNTLGTYAFPPGAPYKLPNEALVRNGEIVYRLTFWNQCDDKLIKESFRINGIMFKLVEANTYIALALGKEGDFPEKSYDVQCTDCSRVFKYYSRHTIPPERIAKGGICCQCSDDYK